MYNAVHHAIHFLHCTLESFWLNFEIFLRTFWAFCWLLFQPNNQKLSNSPFTLLRASKLSICKHLKPVASCCSLTGHLKWKPSQKLSKTFLGGNGKARSTVNKTYHQWCSKGLCSLRKNSSQLIFFLHGQIPVLCNFCKFIL